MCEITRKELSNGDEHAILLSCHNQCCQNSESIPSINDVQVRQHSELKHEVSAFRQNFNVILKRLLLFNQIILI